MPSEATYEPLNGSASRCVVVFITSSSGVFNTLYTVEATCIIVKRQKLRVTFIITSKLVYH